MIRGYIRKLSKIEIRDYARTLVPILESSELDGTRSMRIADAIISYAMKGLKPWYKRASSLQGFISPSFNPLRVIAGYVVYPTPGLNPVVIQSSLLGNVYLFLDIVGGGGGGGGGASGGATYGQGGGGGADGARLIIMMQGSLPSGTQFIPALGGPGGKGGPATSSGSCSPGGNDPGPSGNTQVIIGNGTASITVPGGSPPSLPPPPTGECAGGLGGPGASAIFTYTSNISISTVIQIPPRSLANPNANVNNAAGGYGIGSEYIYSSSTSPLFITNPLTTVNGGAVANAGQPGSPATVNVPSGAIPLRGSGGGGSSGSYNGEAGGNGGAGGPGPIILLIIE